MQLNCCLNSIHSYGAYESFDLATQNNEHENGGYDSHPAAWTDDLGWHMPYRELSGRPRSPLSDGSRKNLYSSSLNDLSAPFLSFTTTCAKPSPIGSRGRAMSAYTEHLYGARGGGTAVECSAKSRAVSTELCLYCDSSATAKVQNARSLWYKQTLR